MAASWPDGVDRIIDGDMTAALAYVTPAGGAVVTAVAPIGLRDRERGTVGFTTSLGFGKKLERIRRNPRIALAYHTRKHGFADEDRYVLAQGDASLTLEPDRDYLDGEIGPRAERYLGPRKSGLFWDRWLQEYYADRVPAILAKYGAKVLARGGRYRILEGPEKFNRFVVIEFPTLEQGVACFDSREYKEAAAFRRRNGVGENELVMVEAGEGPPK